MLVFGLLLAWRGAVQWMGQDIAALCLDNPLWMTAACVSGPIGSLLALCCPDLSWGIMLNSACLAAPLLTYIAYREERVSETSRVLRWPGWPSTGAPAEASAGILQEREELGNLAGLGCHRKMQGELRELVTQPQGLLLVCGPAGAGKSTTLRSVLGELDPELIKIITIENPMRYPIAKVTQIEINRKAGLSYAIAVKKALSKAPQVLMIEEIRDQETATATCAASTTGHLVLSTIQADDTLTAIQNLIALGIEPGTLTDSLSAVLGQRLIRRLCPDCKEQYRPDAELLRRYRIPNDHAADFCRPPRGDSHCATCSGTGYHGRIGIFELLTIDNSIRALIREQAAPAQIRKAARHRGMTTLRENGFRLAIRGWTSLEEVHNATSE